MRGADVVAELKVATYGPSMFPAKNPRFPVQGYWSFGGQGHRFNAPRGTLGTHYGQDLMADEGTSVVVPVDGRVVGIADDPVYGLTVILRGDRGRFYLFAHLHSVAARLREGKRILAGRPLGKLGRTGNRGEGWPTPHLHFEIWRGGPPRSWGAVAIDPLPFLAKLSVYPELEAM
jgi:murein DD-endopeptidase MepM/ murein hydrolase activator NlpD